MSDVIEDGLPHILVVDDDSRLRKLLIKYLSDNGFLASGAENVAIARYKMKTILFDLLVLDRMMPGESGLDLARDIRRKSDLPILMLTAMDEWDDRIQGLECGVDDYLGKPFEPRELLLRINGILRRLALSRPPSSDHVCLGIVKYNLERGELMGSGTTIRLTSSENALLSALAMRVNHVFSREELIDVTNTRGGGRAVDVQITRLRRKIELDPRLPRYLQTVRGKGYMLVPD
ncbi:MAG: DNA-binding response regulator [Magnetovibrio sp.]|nr:DNA-binding response regulator [Magnetovibrio sp.]